MNTPLSVVDLTQTDNDLSYDVGDLRRGYAYSSDRLSKLIIGRDPLFRALAAQRNESINETIWKITEERSPIYKRYAYVTGWGTYAGSGAVSIESSHYTVNSSDISSLAPETKGSFMALKMGTDYLSSSLLGNIFNQETNKITIGATGTCPTFFLENQIIRVSTKAGATAITIDDYLEVKVLNVRTSGQYAYIGCEVVRPIKTATNKYLCSFTASTTPISDTYAYSPGVSTGGLAVLEGMRSYVVGNSYRKGSGIPGWYNTKPYYTRSGLTTIVKHAIGMDNSTYATEFKIEKNEFMRLWSNVLLEHKWDIAQRIYFSTAGVDSDGAQHTQGLVDFAINYGNIFSWTTSKTEDDFTDDISILNDPRYNEIGSYLFVCPTSTFNWFHKLGGYRYRNLMLGNQTDHRGSVYQIDPIGPAQVSGAEVFQYSSHIGKMNVMLDPHFDGTPVKIIAIPTNNVLFRPLAGNGMNRDTTVYPGVIRIQNGGVDAIVNLVQTEFGIQCTMPERWAVWV